RASTTITPPPPTPGGIGSRSARRSGPAHTSLAPPRSIPPLRCRPPGSPSSPPTPTAATKRARTSHARPRPTPRFAPTPPQSRASAADLRENPALAINALNTLEADAVAGRAHVDVALLGVVARLLVGRFHAGLEARLDFFQLPALAALVLQPLVVAHDD